MSDLKLFNQTIQNERWQEYLSSVLGSKKNSFVSNLVSIVANNKNLQECEPATLIYAGIKSTALDLSLEPSLGFSYAIPYKNNRAGTVEAQFQIGYKGLVQLAIRSGQFKTINVRDVRDGEIVGEDFLSGEMQFKMHTENRETHPVVGYIAYFKLVNGFEKNLYMSIEQLKAHGLRYSQTYSSRFENIRNSSKWSTDFDAMAKKTVLKLLLSKYAPLSIEMIEAVKFDQSVITEDGPKYVDNTKTVSAEEEANDFLQDAEIVNSENDAENENN